MKKRARELNPKKQTLIANLSEYSAPSLIKHLASCNDTVRFQSLRLLQTWLTTTNAESKPQTTQIVSDSDMKKLWKGLFYCLWHCDKAPAQSELINRIASLLSSLGSVLSVQYFQAFLVTLRREWTGIDHLRLDKFYLCIRRFVKAMFVLVRKCDWELGLLGKFMDVLEFNGFLADDNLLGNGVCYHVVAVFLDELKGGFVPVRKEVVDLLFRPFFGVMLRSLDKVLIGKVKSLVFEELLNVGKALLDRKRGGVGIEGEEDVYDDVVFGLISMKMGFAARLYEIGSAVDCVQGNRKVVLKLHEDFLKLEKRFESSGVEIEIPDVVVEDDDEEVPGLIPIERSENNGALEQIVVKGNDSVVDANGVAEEGEDLIDDVEDARKYKKARKESDGRSKKAKVKKRKENNQPLDENSSVPEACDPIAKPGVEASLTQGSKSSDKKRKKKEKKNEMDTNVSEASLSANVDGLVNELSSSCEQESNGNVLNESVIANLQKQFENVAAELGSDDGDGDFTLSDALASISDKPTTKKKKKRAKSCDTQNLVNKGDVGHDAVKIPEGSASAKKVSFAMKNNLVWKPHSPLPPQSLRIPPSVTPRGSALKKGVLPGPIREVPSAKKKWKKKKERKILKRNVPQ